MQLHRSSRRGHDLEVAGCRLEALEHRDQRRERVRQDIQELAYEGPGARALQLEPRRSESEVAVYQHARLQIRDSAQELAEPGVPQELMPGADEAIATSREPEQLFALRAGLDERLFDVHICPIQPCLPRGAEVRSGRRADLHNAGC